MSKQKNKQRRQTTRKRASVNLCKPLICAAKKSRTEPRKISIKNSFNKAKEKAGSRTPTINRLRKQQKGKYGQKKFLKSRKWHRQQPA
jgi:hypothetical protein